MGSIVILGSRKEAKVNYCFAKGFKLHWSLAQSVETLPGERAAKGPGRDPRRIAGTTTAFSSLCSRKRLDFRVAQIMAVLSP